MKEQSAWYLERWRSLDAWLHQHVGLWQSVPFYTPEPKWGELYPSLRHALLKLSDQEYEALAQDDDASQGWLSQWLPDLSIRSELLSGLNTHHNSNKADTCTLSEAQAPHMPERKRLQAGKLTHHLQPFEQSITDWCSGMGHLARTLAANGEQPVIGLEWNAELVKRGQTLIEASNRVNPSVKPSRVTLAQQDVMQLQGNSESWPKTPHIVALHACGDLHRHLLKEAVKAHQARISLAPCCFHLSHQNHWQPLAKATQHSALRGLSTELMRLAVQETVTATSRVSRQRETLNCWRLGYEALRQSLTQDSDYRPLASCSIKQLALGFSNFCLWAASQHQCSLPKDVNWDKWLVKGQQRHDQVKRDELLRHQFRRPLEVWLVLDYVIFLQESGYQVELTTFCERHLSPRNLLIDAKAQ
ncbi:MAG: SAM-dependent methyltransferase [Nitrincola sp.]|nr:SAM-dependent methyltransferase [Nitrincola sp.]